MRLIDELSLYSQKDIIPLHMPGHKRSTDFDYLKKLSAELDITEVRGMDSLHGADGILLNCMKRAARLWKSRRSFFLVNGSTCGNLAGIRAATSFGDSVIIARNCHKSVYNAVEICGLNPTYIYPEKLNSFNIYGGITHEQVKKAFEQSPNSRLLILTSPTYEGVISDLAGICEVAHSFGAAVMVDEAHGSHLDLSAHFTGGAVRAGADIVVQSLHKTLPSLTQTAIMHVNGDIISADKVALQLSVFETSSPSYLLMSSIDGCVALLEEKKEQLFNTWSNNIDTIYNELAELKHLQLLSPKSAPEMFGFDKSKLVISTAETDIDGNVLFSELYEQGIECEMAAADYVVAMTGMTDSETSLERFVKAVTDADKHCTAAKKSVHIFPKAETRLSPLTAVMQKKREVRISEAEGTISAEYIWAYPPGIPIVAAGELITESIVKELDFYRENGIALHHSSGCDTDCIEIVVGY